MPAYVAIRGQPACRDKELMGCMSLYFAASSTDTVSSGAHRVTQSGGHPQPCSTLAHLLYGKMRV